MKVNLFKGKKRTKEQEEKRLNRIINIFIVLGVLGILWGIHLLIQMWTYKLWIS